MDEKNQAERIRDLEQKITVLTKIIEERFRIEIDFRDDVERFIDDFLNQPLPQHPPENHR